MNPRAYRQVVKAILAKTQSGEANLDEARESVTVSYTHLTLPTN